MVKLWENIRNFIKFKKLKKKVYKPLFHNRQTLNLIKSKTIMKLYVIFFVKCKFDHCIFSKKQGAQQINGTHFNWVRIIFLNTVPGKRPF